MTTGTKTRSRRGPILAGLAVVGTAAAVLSFETLDKFAKAVGYTAAPTLNLPGGTHLTIYLSWLLPIAIDAFGLLATLAWLTPSFNKEIRDYAKRVAIGDIAGSAVLNAIYHGMAAAKWDVDECWPVVIGVGAIAPVILPLAVHLGAMVVDHEPATAKPDEAPSEGPAAVRAPLPEAPSKPLPAAADLDAVWAAVDGTEAPAAEPAKRFQVTRQKHPKKQSRKQAAEAPAGASEKRSLTDEEAVRLLLEEHPRENPSQRAAQTLLSVGWTRAGSILQLADQKRSETQSNVVQMHPTEAASAAN